MKKIRWSHVFKRHRRKPKPKTGLVVRTGPKKHMTEPDMWKPPFPSKKAKSLKTSKQELVIVNSRQPLDLGNITATVGILIQSEMDHNFKLFVHESLERFSNFDWGGVNDNEGHMNDQKVMMQTGTICGVYTNLRNGVQIWIISDLDHGVTRICLSEER